MVTDLVERQRGECDRRSEAARRGKFEEEQGSVKGREEGQMSDSIDWSSVVVWLIDGGCGQGPTVVNVSRRQRQTSLGCFFWQR